MAGSEVARQIQLIAIIVRIEDTRSPRPGRTWDYTLSASGPRRDPQGAAIMDKQIDRRSVLKAGGRCAAGVLTFGAFSDLTQPSNSWAQPASSARHPASARALDRIKNRFTFQISVDVATIEQGLGVAAAALAGGVDIVEMGTPLLKNQGVANVVPAFRRKFPEALLLADMKTMDGGAFEARAVYAGGGNIFDFLGLAGVDTAKAICAVRDEFRRSDAALPRLVFSDIMVPHQGPAKQAGDAA